MSEKPAVVSEPVDDLIGRRWSPRAFDPDRDVTPAQITSLLEAARWAPSCFGAEPWRFLVWHRSADRPGWERALACLADSNRRWAMRAPLLLLVVADGLFAHDGKPNRWAGYDSGAAAVSLCLQAGALGLAAHQMGGFDGARVRTGFGIPEQFTPMAMIAVGHPGPPDLLEPELKQREEAPRRRRPLGETFFDRHWGKPAR